MIPAKFSHITKRYPTTFNVIFVGEDGENLNTVCKWIENSYDVNHYFNYDSGYVVGLNKIGMYGISELERLKAVEEVNKTKLMRKRFIDQLDGTEPATEKTLIKYELTKYYNGDDYNIGDVILLAFLIGETIEPEEEGLSSRIPMTIITLNENHFNLFEECFEHRHMEIPAIKLKQ
jgi:hypothetical protein